MALESKDALALGTTVSVVPQAFDRSGVQVIKLPTSALVQSGKSTAVWVLDSASMTVKLQPITVATADGNEAVVADGLQPGMQVVTAGVHVQKFKLLDGTTDSTNAATVDGSGHLQVDAVTAPAVRALTNATPRRA